MMKMITIFKVTICSNNNLFISSLYFFLLFCLQIKGVNSVRHFNSLSARNYQKSKLFANGTESNIDVTFMGMKIEYDILRMYDFFVPEVDVVCQCSCSNDTLESFRPLDHECTRLVNSTTTCTIHITVDSVSSICSKYYKLCCQAYFTKTKMMKPFKALHLKYKQSLLNFNIVSKFLDNKLNEHNVTITEYVKNLLVSPDKMLHIGEFAPVHPIPDGWYFIEDGSNELLYSDAMNEIDEQNMNKIGWFQYNNRRKQSSGMSKRVLEKHLQVKFLDCYSNPPKYEWKLDATHYVSNGLLHLPKNVERVAEMYKDKDIANISINLIKEKIRMDPLNTPSVNFTLSDVTSFPFLFTSSIEEYVLNLTFIKGNGSFCVKMTSPHWRDILKNCRKYISSSGNILNLPFRNYDSCLVCVHQDGQQLCQIPTMWTTEIPSVTLWPSNYSTCDRSILYEKRNSFWRIFLPTSIGFFLMGCIVTKMVIHFKISANVWKFSIPDKMGLEETNHDEDNFSSQQHNENDESFFEQITSSERVSEEADYLTTNDNSHFYEQIRNSDRYSGTDAENDTDEEGYLKPKTSHHIYEVPITRENVNPKESVILSRFFKIE